MPLPTLVFLIVLAVVIVYLAVWLFCIRPRPSLDAPDMKELKKYDYAHRGFYEKDQSIPENSVPFSKKGDNRLPEGRVRKRKNPSVFTLGFWWEKMDSNHRSDYATDLQSAPIGHSGILP